MNKQNLECENITNDTKNELKEKNLIDITKKWERNCPKCNDTIYHTNKINRDRLNRLQTICRKCVGESQRLYKTDRFERVCVKCNKITIYKTRKSFNQAERLNRLCCSCAPRQPCKEETKRKIGIKNSGENNGMFGKTHSLEYKVRLKNSYDKNKLKPTAEGIEKMRNRLIGRKTSEQTKLKQRLSHIERLKNNGGICPMHNKNACEFIDNYGKQNGYNFQHALNGGEFYIKELGYFVDGYDNEKNVVFEYDEPHHIYLTTGKLKERDVIRMNLIKQHLNNCKFIRYSERLNEIKEY